MIASDNQKKQLNDFEKGRIFEMKRRGMSDRAIGKEIGRDHKTIANVINKFNESGTVQRLTGSGRKRKLNEQDVERIIHEVSLYRDKSGKQVQKDLGITDVSERTIRRIICRALEFKSFWSTKQPFINEEIRNKRLQWALNHKDWTIERWNNVLWSDKCPFVIRFNKQRRVWRIYNPQYQHVWVNKRVPKFDIEVSVWGCFSSRGLGSLQRIYHGFSIVEYQMILENSVLPSYRRLFPSGNGVFQQDIDLQNIYHGVNSCCNINGIETLEWIHQSPDLNPIENIWSEIEHKVKDSFPQNEEELFQLLQQAWSHLSTDFLAKLVSSMPRRCQSVIDNNGNATKF